jgi:hypothetical protein
MYNNKTFCLIIDKIKNEAEKKNSIFFELAIVMGIVGLFSTLSILTADSRAVYSGAGIIFLAVFLDFGTISCCLLCLVKHFADIRIRYLKYIKRNRMIFILCAVFIVLAAFQFDVIPRGDGNFYYGRLMFNTDKYENTLKSFINDFIIWDHAIHGLCLFLAIGEMIFPRQVVGVYGVSLILTVVSFLCLYGTLGRLFPRTSNVTKSIGTAVLMFNPYILGLFTYINPDYFVCVFTVIMVYCYLKDFKILFVFFGAVLAITKEPGAMIYCVFIATAVLTEFIKCKEANIQERIRKIILSIKNLAYMVPPVMFLFFFTVTNRIAADTSGIKPSRLFTWDNQGIECFGFNPKYILDRLIQLFVSNSIWLTSAVCICGLAVYIYRLNGKRQIYLLEQKNIPAFMGILGILAAYTAFMCLFIIGLCPRYATLSGYWLSIFAFASVHVLFRRKAARNIVLGALALIFLVQTYYNIDPYMRLNSFYLHSGKRFIYGAVYKDVPRGWAGDSRNYNYEHTFYESLLKSILRQIDPDEDIIIVQAIATHAEINLCGVETSIYWNTRTKKRTYDYKDPDSIYLKVPVLNNPEEVQTYVYPDTFYLLTIPFFENYTPQFLKEFEKRNYSVSDTYKAENTVGLMTVYKMSKFSDS